MSWPFGIFLGCDVFLGVLVGLTVHRFIQIPRIGFISAFVGGNLCGRAARLLDIQAFSLQGWTGALTFLTAFFVTLWFLSGGGGKLWRLLKKTSAALRKLLEKVKELVPTPVPQPAPVG